MKHTTSEQIMGFTEQPPETCPLIDSLYIYLENGCELSEFQLEECRVQLEAIRTRVMKIRGWANDWKDDHIRNIEIYRPDEYEAIEQALSLIHI